MLSARVAGAGALSLAGLAARYAAGRVRADRAWPVLVESRLGDIGEVGTRFRCFRWWSG